MARQNAALLAFNRGVVSPKALARVDLERMRLSAEVQTNWMPKTQGAMSLRAGFKYLGSSKGEAKAQWIDFVAATDDTALIEVTNALLRFWVNDAPISRPSISTAISNSSFASATGWTSTLSGGATTTFGGSGLTLNAYSRGGVARVTRSVTVSGGDQGVEHALRVVVTRGPVTFRCGSSAGADDYIRETSLKTGVHSLSFTPTGNFHLTFQSKVNIDRIVASCSVEAAGIVEISAPWAEASLGLLRWDQSADVVFVACEGYLPRRIERRSTRSWSLVNYAPDDGPFIQSRTADVKLKVGATVGNTTLTADAAFFRPGHVGALFRIFHGGYNWRFYLGAEETYTDPWRVNGVVNTSNPDVLNDRDWTYTISGTWSGILRNYRAFGDKDTGYQRYRRSKNADNTIVPIGSNATYTNDDTDSNSIVYYKLGFESGSYTSGVAIVDVSYDGGGEYGICRVTGYVSSTQVDVEVLRPFAKTVYTDDWKEGYWSDIQGYPTSVGLYEGRLWWAGQAEYAGSVSDDYESFDEETEGDAGPIRRSIGRGPVDRVNWIVPLQRLLLGTVGAEVSVKSSSFDEPLSPTNNSGKECSTQGSARIRAVKVDTRGIFVQRSGHRVFQLVYDTSSYDYRSDELTRLSPDIAKSGVVDVVVQRQPDTRIHCVLGNGTVAVFTHEPADEVACWTIVETDGAIERVVVLPGVDEDQVYYHVRRTINGVTKRYLEKVALEGECDGRPVALLADSFFRYSGSAVTTIPGLSHLEGREVVVWGWNTVSPFTDEDGNVIGHDLGVFTVASGQITGLPEAVTDACVGLAYTARYKSTKLAYAAQMGTALNQKKRVPYLGVVFRDTHYQGLRYGPSFDVLDDLPLVEFGADTPDHTIWQEFDRPAFEFPGEWSTDSRLCLEAASPRPCCLLAAVVGVDTNEK